jgi:IS1 family transposase
LIPWLGAVWLGNKFRPAETLESVLRIASPYRAPVIAPRGAAPAPCFTLSPCAAAGQTPASVQSAPMLRPSRSAPVEAGDVWTWTAIDADSKLLVSWYLGARDTDAAMHFLTDLRSRLANRIQLTSDGHRPYLQAVDSVFGNDVDYAMLNKIYGADPQGKKRYSPAKCIGAEKRKITGNPDAKHISTSYAERANLTMRMHMRRFTRLTNAFSKKMENHAATIALHSMFYNFVRTHQTLKVTPAMAAGVTDRLWEISDVVQVLEDFENQRKAEPSFEIERERIGQGYFVRATLTNGATDTIYGFATEADADKWIRNESVVWLYERRKKASAFG